MSKSSQNLNRRNRDGTSQADRRQAALQPGYVSVDERSLEDLLAFAHAYGAELNYFNEHNEVGGDWRAFIDNGQELDPQHPGGAYREYLEQAAAYAHRADKPPGDKTDHFARPHFALYLSFLRLLGNAQQEMNGFTQRHLEFYYQQILRMSKKSAMPDRVNVLLHPSPQREEVEVPEGHRLFAGRDSEGRDLYYRTERRILVNHANIAQLRAVYAERQVTGIREAREEFTGTYHDAILNMLGVALGHPLPGDPMPEYKPEQGIDYDFLLELKRLVNFSRNDLFLAFFELRDLMRLKDSRDTADSDWGVINYWLEMLGKNRSGDVNFKLAPADPRDFDANLVKALGGEVDFAGLTQVENIDDLYHQRTRQEVKDFILYDKDDTENNRLRRTLFFNSVDDFVAMMQLKVKSDNEWKEINRLLEVAGQRKREDPGYRLVPEDETGFDPSDFSVNFKAALEDLATPSPVDFASQKVASINEYFAALLHLERYFYMSAENFAYTMQVATESREAALRGEWDKVYSILAQAYRNKVYQQRRTLLSEVFNQVFDDSSDPLKSYRAVLYYVLGEEAREEDSTLMERVQEFIPAKDSYDTLAAVEGLIKKGDIDKLDWQRIYRILELAQRYREQLPEPVARIQRWINLHPHADATLVQTQPDSTRWKTFGMPLSVTEQAPEAIMGWALGSPVLLLSAGQRQVTLTLGFDEAMYKADKIKPLFPEGPVKAGEDMGPFDIRVSTGDDWIVPETVQIKHGGYYTLSGVKPESGQRPLSGLQFILDFSVEIDPIIAPSAQAGLDCRWPVIKLMLRQVWDEDNKRYITHYEPFEELQLLKVHLQARVGEAGVNESGLLDLHIQNDQRTLKAKKPFTPFGNSPAVGTRFYLGHAELIHKRLDHLDFNIEWMGAPADLAAYYANYGAADFDWTFKTRLSLVDKRFPYQLQDAPLFNATDASKPHTISIADVGAAIQKARPGYHYRHSLETPEGKDLTNWRRYLQWELQPLDFQHLNYRAVTAGKAAELRAATANANAVAVFNATASDADKKDEIIIVPEDYQVNPPYTPTVQRLEIHYSASRELDLLQYVPKQAHDQVFHIHPFGFNEAHPKSPSGCWFLPKYAAEGELYIGIANASPPQYLSVLFQMAEGSANPDLEPAPIEWCYLNGDRWLSMAEGAVRMDTTRGLINSGIIEFELLPAEPSTRLPPGYYWIRASIAKHSDSVCETFAIHAQAVSATLLDEPYAADHYSQPLPENSISGLSPPIAGISEVVQPYTSFGGKAAEQDEIFYTRVSERLRHKQRALSIWDYERLILERFPQIYKAKCLPADASGDTGVGTGADSGADSGASGKVSVIVIPDIVERLPFDPFAPKAPADLIAEIEAYLQDKVPPYVNVEVRNAHFVPVKVRIGVRFKEGYDSGFYKARLTRDLNHFLSPWAYQEGADIVIGGRIYANSIINFLDQRDYVDYVAAIKLFTIENGRPRLALAQGSEGYFVTTQRADGVLVASREHEIDLIAQAGYTEEQFSGINYMKVELDFVVG